MRRIAGWLLVVLGTALVVAGGCNPSANNELEAAAQEKAEKDAVATVSRLVAEHNAVVQWNEPIADLEWPLPLFTINWQSVLVRKDGRPILFLASAKDVVKCNGHYRLILEDSGLLSFSRLLLDLKCNPESARKILEARKEFFDEYAVIAHIESVERAAFQVSTSDFGEVFIDDSPEIFIARGTCVDLVYLGTVNLSDQFYATGEE